MTEASDAKVSLGEAWEKVRVQLKAGLGADVFDSWFQSMRLEEAASKDKMITLSVATEFLRKQVGLLQYRSRLVDLWSLQIGDQVELKVVVRSRTIAVMPGKDPEADRVRPRQDRFPDVKNNKKPVAKPAPPPDIIDDDLNVDNPVTEEPVPTTLENEEAEAPWEIPDHQLSDLDRTVRQSCQDFSLGERLSREFFPRVVSRLYKVPLDFIKSGRRDRDTVKARQIGMWLAKHCSPSSLPMIGKAFGDRDHTTVLHSVRKYDALYASSDEVKADLSALKQAIERWRPDKNKKVA